MTNEEKFLRAAKNGNLKLMKQYIKAGIDIETMYGGWTALMWASCNGYLKIVEYLVEMGAGMDIQDSDGRTALIWSSRYNHFKVVEYLVAVGVGIDIEDRWGMTALMYALRYNHTEVVRILEDSGVYHLRKKLDIENASDVIKDSCIF